MCVVGEVYVLSYYLFRKIWPAFAIGLLVGTDVIVISFVKPIMTEGFSLAGHDHGPDGCSLS